MTTKNLKINTERFGVSVILFASLLWGTTGTAAALIPQVSPLAIGAFSMGVGGIMLAVFACQTMIKDWRILTKNRLVVLGGAMALAVYPLAFYTSMRIAGIAIGTMISIATAPFFVALLERLFNKNNTIDRRWVFSVILGTIGMTILTLGKGDIEPEAEVNQYLGVLLGVVAGFSYAIYAWAAKALIDQGVDSKSAMGSIFGLGALLLLPSLWITGDHLFESIRTTSIALYLALIPMFIGYVCFGYGLKSVSASKASLLTLFEPAVAAVFALAVVNERIGASGWLGVGLIMLCLFLQSYQPKPSPS
ncbi:DMT family transporter [Vibrio ostreicida]|uniref:EamA family transporter n=1 Tax=Vibrio ostreicida TaxID=526588 RepID=A0ABT8BWJ7_9VIBR|nr:EamA family transporter [Vibrio ostreicida]MDN3611552.1 EamA family transporter [Vibrio ostreicida]